jgi:precorrin-6A/cobalt-precorrin-6A reductase
MPMMVNQGSAMPRVLLLGGTTEAAEMASALAAAGVDAVYSYAGRTYAPVAQPLPVRVGGFGGVVGLCEYLQAEEITHVIDATHPFAAQISRNAVEACAIGGTPLIALEREPWTPVEGDRWIMVPDHVQAVAALGATPRRVFLAIGRQTLQAFADAPQHRYLLRLVDPPADALPLPQADLVIARGPFSVEGDRVLLQGHGIDIIVAKNAGGRGAEAKLIAARALGLPVVLIDRPPVPHRKIVRTAGEAMCWLFPLQADRRTGLANSAKAVPDGPEMRDDGTRRHGTLRGE